MVGFDNMRFTEQLAVPWTAVDQPESEMGRRAAEMLMISRRRLLKAQAALRLGGRPRHRHGCRRPANRLAADPKTAILLQDLQ